MRLEAGNGNTFVSIDLLGDDAAKMIIDLLNQKRNKLINETVKLTSCLTEP